MRPTRTGLLMLLPLVTLVLNSCAGQEIKESPLPPREATHPPSSTMAEEVYETTEEAAPEEGRLLLNEVLPPTDTEVSPFIELKNAGRTAVVVGGVTIENERSETIELPSDLPPLNYGEMFLISLGLNPDSQSGGFSTESPSFLSIENGTIRLHDAEGALLDRVDWGVNNPESVRLSRGGIEPLEFPRGSSIGRPPLSSVQNPLEWTTFAPHQITPGAPNPLLAVEILIPRDDAFFEQPEIPLSWYVVPGAVSYRVQVAQDAAFEAIAIDAVVDSPPVSTDPLPTGEYFWRVQAIGLDGTESGYSPTHSFTVATPMSAASIFLTTYSLGAPPPQDEERRKVLGVDDIRQKKDSNMLLLESPRPDGAHAWNVAHPGYSGDDPADSSNCALAASVMLNHYYKGDLTQDILGWEVRKDIRPGPEMDLNWGKGLNMDQIQQVLDVALPGSNMYYIIEPDSILAGQPQRIPSDQFFDRVVALIDAERPLLAVYPGHATVISGYRIHNGKRYYHLNDPTSGPYWAAADHYDWTFFFEPGNAGNKDDPTHYMDFDHDGINNFDEIYRFGTNPNNPDTDNDGLKDGIDVFASVYDASYGYSGDMNMRGRDFDEDGKPMELDFDADDGGCMDSYEDRNQNGIYERDNDETWNFADWDDECWKLTSDWTFSDEWGDTWIQFEGSFLVGEDQQIEGKGNAFLAHTGPCLTASDSFGITLAGLLEDEMLKLEVTDIPEADGPDVSDDLRCTVGETIGEAYAVSFGSGWALPEVIEIPAEDIATVQLETRSPFASRAGDLELTIERKEIDYSQ